MNTPMATQRVATAVNVVVAPSTISFTSVEARASIGAAAIAAIASFVRMFFSLSFILFFLSGQRLFAIIPSFATMIASCATIVKCYFSGQGSFESG